MNFFIAPPSKVLSWLNRKGYYGTVYDAFSEYVQEGSLLEYGTIYDHLVDRLTQSGYNVSGYEDLDDMLVTMFMEKTGEVFRFDAERKFFEDDSLDMFTTESGFIVRDDDLNTVRDDDTNIVKDDS